MINNGDNTELIRNEILVVSYGTTSEESRRLSIGAVEQTIRDAAGEGFTVRRCFTSGTVIRLIEKREGIHIDNVDEALDRAAETGIKNLVIQPTHLMKGIEYEKIRSILAAHADSFNKTALGDPLLSSDRDFIRTAEAITDVCRAYEDGRTAVVLMGHGTEAAANGVYAKMQHVLTSLGKDDYFVGTVEAWPSLDDVISAVGSGNYDRVVLRPLMLVAGNHAVKDMADPDEPKSWYSRFTAAGYETICILEGLGQIAAVRGIYAEHARNIINSLNRNA